MCAETENPMEEYYKLLKEWCDALVSRQITQIKDPGLYGAVLCPACSAIHGRCHGAVYPLLFMADKTKDNEYIRCAEKLIAWSKHMAQPDGGYVNDGMCEWKGTTVFAAVCFAKAYRYGRLMKAESFQELDTILKGFLSYLYHVFDVKSGNINYVAGAACALELGGKLYKNEEYRRLAGEYAHSMFQFVTENGLIYGEGETKRDLRSKKGCLPIDLGYNLEETIPLLAEYAVSAGDIPMQKRLAEIAQAHLNFMLPDGGIDNSAGTRMDKWTYWGSRTSDGCAAGLLTLSAYNDEFAAAAIQSIDLLKACTHRPHRYESAPESYTDDAAQETGAKEPGGSLLYGGPDVCAQGEPPCIHHTFTHAAGLASAIEWMEETHFQGRKESYQRPLRSKYYPEMDLYLHTLGDWRATITGYDCGEKEYCAPRGGALSLLYHRLSGPIFVSGMTRYERYEIMNTQRHRDGADTPLTVRLQKDLGIWKDNIEVTPVIRAMGETVALADILDREAVIAKTGENTYEVKGRLTDERGAQPHSGEAEPICFQKTIRFLPEKVRIVWTHEGGNLSLYLPAAASLQDTVRVEGCVCEIEKADCVVRITASSAFDPLCTERIFSHVPGFHAVPLKITNVPSGTAISVEVFVTV